MYYRTHAFCKILILIIIVLGIVIPANGNMQEDVTNSIADGIDLALIRLTNGFVNSAVANEYGVGEGYNNSNIALDAIFSIATYTPNPFEMPVLAEMRADMKSFFFDIWWILILIAMITFGFLFIFSIDSFSSIYDATGFDAGKQLKLLLLIIIGGLLIVMFEMAFVWITLLICDEFSKAVMMGSLNAIAISPDNVVLYVIMGFAYGALWLCFEYRALVIMFFSVISFVFGAMLLYPPTSNWSWKAHLYFIQIVFFQFAIVLWYCFCIILISSSPGPKGSIYIIMVLVSIYMSYKFIFKLDFIRMAGQVTRIVLIKKL